MIRKVSLYSLAVLSEQCSSFCMSCIVMAKAILVGSCLKPSCPGLVNNLFVCGECGS